MKGTTYLSLKETYALANAGAANRENTIGINPNLKRIEPPIISNKINSKEYDDDDDDNDDDDHLM